MLCIIICRVVKSDVLAAPGRRGSCPVANVPTSSRTQRPRGKIAFIWGLRGKFHTVRFLRGRRGHIITTRSEVASSDPSVPSEESDGILAIRPIEQTACPVPFHTAAGSNELRARPSDWPDMPEARPSGRSRPRAVQSSGHNSRPPDRVVVAAHRTHLNPLSVFSI